ncbi:MAG TPA: chromosome segregation protein SMC, partial [Nitrolancea sp.]|nr:chromosome segregation protein SMC [Nitrolancea sp.]
EQAVGVLQAEVEAARARRAEQEEALRAVTRRQAESERSRAAGEARLALLDGQSAELAAEQARLGAALAERRDSADDLVQRRDIARAAREASEAQLIALTDARGVPWAASERAHAELERLRAAERAAQRTLAGLEARHDALARLAESGAGLYAGVRAVLDASRDGALSGVVGTLAGLLRVPGELEAALEAALGAHLQDIVVERWTDAERAIEHLKRRQAGRATFQPLDTVRSLGVGRAGTGPRGAGIRGVAAGLIEFDPRVEPVVAGLLGRVLVAEDLQATRAILSSLSSGWSVVTLDGEIARASGTVTGGARERQSGVLARERELRELPERRRALEAELSVIRRQANELTARSVGLIDELSRLEEQIAAETDAGRRAAGDEERAERLLADEARLAGREHARLAEIETRLGALQAEQARARTAIAEARVAAERTGAERERLASQLQTEAGSGQDDALAEARAELRALGERKRALHAERERLATRRLAAERQGAARRERLVALVQELAALEDEQARLNAAREAAAHDSRQLDGRVAAASAALQAAAAAEQAASAALARLAEEGRALERERDRLALERSRRADELELLLERAARDLDVPDAAPLLGEAEAIVDPAPLEGRIHRLRERLRRIGLVAEDAVEQYELEADRYRFLRRQLDDVRAAADALRGLMNQLEGNMDEALERTFTEVAEAFSTTFTALFGGGKARLVRVSDEDALSGLDIVAQPPGKRPQNLALLSGGERALTAVALLFAILKVNPAPFCLLDEVDAALDESNVVRVRDELRALAERTQFVVVTHNRATIEGADTLYGITMGDDGVSRTLSLRLPAEPVTG